MTGERYEECPCVTVVFEGVDTVEDGQALLTYQPAAPRDCKPPPNFVVARSTLPMSLQKPIEFCSELRFEVHVVVVVKPLLI